MQSTGATFRFVIVASITLLFAAISLPDALLPWHPFSWYGYSANDSGVVVAVVPGAPAARAGIETGDVVDLHAVSPRSRFHIATMFSVAKAGSTIELPIVKPSGQRRVVTLTAEPKLRSFADNLADLVQMAGYALFLIAGAALVLLRPSAMTWAFFWYSICSIGVSVLVISELSEPIHDTALGLSTLVTLAYVPFMIFALRFPSGELTGWKARAERTILWSLIAIAPLSLYSVIGIWFAAPYLSIVGPLCQVVLPICGYIAGSIFFAHTYLHAPAEQRPRIRWVVLGFLIGYAGTLALFASTLVVGKSAIPVWLNDVLLSTNIFIPLTVAYAIVKHHVIDVQFFLSRALVYGLLTTVALVALTFLHRVVSGSFERYGVLIDIAGTLVVGISFQKLHDVVDRVVDNVVFRGTHLAEQKLSESGEAMLYAKSPAAIDELLCQDPVQNLSIASASVFRPGPEGTFVCVASIGGGSARPYSGNEPVLLRMQAFKKPVDEGGILYVPLMVRDKMDGFVCYGTHTNGSAIDPDERAILEQFVRSAATAHDHLTSVERAAEILRLRIENQTLRSVVRESHTTPAT